MKNIKNKKIVILIALIVLLFIAISSLVGCQTGSQPVEKFTVTYIAGAGGKIDGTAIQTVAYGESATTVTAMPDEGYKFVQWSDNEINHSRREENVTSDLTVTAIFEKISFEVSYKTDGNGTIEGNANQTVAYRENTTEVTARPNFGYRFLKWSDGNTNQTRTDIDVQSNLTLTAIFERLTYTVKYITDGNGIIIGEAIQEVAYSENTTSVIAVPNNGYRFVKWSDNNLSYSRNESNVTSDLTVTAIFERLPYTYTVNYITDGNGTIKGEAIQKVAYSENTTTVIAVPNEGYEFLKWNDNNSNPERQDIYITYDITVTAIFKKISFKVNYKTEGNGTIEGNANQTVAYREDTTTVTAKPNYGYRFLKWSDGNTNPKRTDFDIQSNLTVTAIFVNYYTVEYKTDGNGTIKGESSQNIIYGKSASAVTAVPNHGYVFNLWSDGNTEITRTDKDIKADKTIYAYFTKIKYSVNYITSDYKLGSIYGDPSQQISYGEDAREVIANPRENCAFIGWSDGVETLERQDKNVTCDMTLTAYFGYSISYAVDGNVGGTIKGNCNQKLLPEDTAKAVTAVADDGYIFAGWSDMQLTADRQDVAKRSFEYIAYFELIEKTFKYNYSDIFGTPLNTTVTLNRYAIENTKFTVPSMENYKFCGWYADNEYATKVVNENGKLMLGYYTFTLETDTLYAKWQRVDEEILTFKVLIVMVDEVHASLLSSVTNDYVDVDYKMSAIERKILSLVPNKLEEWLNDWFDGKVIFEFDTYYTVIPLGTDSIEGGLNGYLESYGIVANDISEVDDILADYNSIITTFGLNDYGHLLHSVGGSAGKKYAYVHIESILSGWNINSDSLQEQYYYLKNNTYNYIWVQVAEGHLHEFTHTIEQHYVYGTIYEFHRAGAGIETMKQYLLCQFDSGDGKLVGIPDSFWMNPECWEEDWLYKP